MADGSVTIEVTLTKDQLEKGLKNLKGTINSALPGASKTLSTFAKGFDKVGDLVTEAGKKVSIFTTGVAAIGTYAINAGKNFESQMSKVSAISGAVGNDLIALKNKAKEMGSTTKFSATEAGQAFEYMSMAGWKTEDMLNGIEGIMNLAAASGEDLANTSDIVTDALTAFGLAASDSSHFADVLARASSSSNTNVSLMGETFKYVAPLAGSLKYSIEDTAVAIGLMANAGIKGTQAGTALRSMITRLTDPPKDAAQSLEKLGFSIKDSNGNIKPLNTSLKELRKKFENLSDAEKVEMASSIAGQEAMSGFLAIINASDSDFENLTNQINNADGAAKQMADTMNDNLDGAITLFKSNLESVGISIYEDFQNPLKDLVRNASELLTNLSPVFKGVFGEASNLITKFSGAIKNISDRLANMDTAQLEQLGQTIFKIVACGPMLLGVGQGFSTLGSVFSGLSGGAQILENITSKAIGLPTVISGLGGNLKSASGGFTDFFSTINSGFTTMFSGGIFDKVGTFFSNGFGKITNIVSSFGNKLLTPFQSISGKIGNIFSPVINTLSSFGDKVGGVFSKVTGAIGSAFPNVTAGLSKITGAFGGLFGNIGSKLGDFLPIFTKCFNIAGIIGLVVTGLGLLQGQFGEQINSFLEMVTQKGPEIITNLVDGIVSKIPDLIAKGGELLQNLLSAIIANLPSIIERWN